MRCRPWAKPILLCLRRSTSRGPPLPRSRLISRRLRLRGHGFLWPVVAQQRSAFPGRQPNDKRAGQRLDRDLPNNDVLQMAPHGSLLGYHDDCLFRPGAGSEQLWTCQHHSNAGRRRAIDFQYRGHPVIRGVESQSEVSNRGRSLPCIVCALLSPWWRS